ncbi:CYFA0S31e01079g1_1 [Cyberlindnera fabianii]|uniref:CYFA0S31e01079g1_1 n=2 Tax=Cyberlindnera fabianii TaxID=36022 RepID=A0A061BK48_CYBFA|nr:CYFA0S31e01079g1_1 [Cyberlindnera fabianii]
MVSELEILLPFLLERSSAKEAVPLSRIKRAFAKDTPNSLLKRIRKYLMAVIDERSINVNESLHHWCNDVASASTSSRQGIERIKNTDGDSSEEKSAVATQHLKVVSKLLDDELKQERERFLEILRELNEYNEDLEDVAYPGKREIKDTMTSEIIELLDGFESIHK